MIYVTGDCHANWNKFSIDNFPEQKEMSQDDYVIVCGDFGIWNDTKEERGWLDWLCKKSFTVLFVDGNHENFDRLYSDEFKIVDFHGGKAHKIRNNVYHLMRGNIFDICGKKIFAFGGASSHDVQDGILNLEDFKDMHELIKTYRSLTQQGKMLRINHMSWWKEELPSQEEMDFGLQTLKENGNKVDYIISHCCPQNVAAIFSHGKYKKDILTEYFDTVMDTTDFKKWFFGHYHRNENILSKFVMLYEQIIRIA